jgi:AcrR family transcriptional regulator
MQARIARAKPLAAEDRRRAILEAAVPLLIRKGPSVTTAEVARAADIAEGTLFRAFPDKSALILEVARAAMDPASVTEGIRAIDQSLGLEQRLSEAAHLLRDYFNQLTALGESLRSASIRGGAKHGDMARLIRESSAAISAALTALFDQHRDALRVPPAAAVAAFRGLVFASAHPMLPPNDRLATGEVIGILLSGIAARRDK